MHKIIIAEIWRGRADEKMSIDREQSTHRDLTYRGFNRITNRHAPMKRSRFYDYVRQRTKKVLDVMTGLEEKGQQIIIQIR